MTHVPLFGNAGRQAAPAPPPPERPAPVEPVSAQAERLGQQLRELAAGTVAPEDAFEPALRAILDSTNCAAGALCLYDQRHEMLRLAAEVGLSDEGCKHLRSVGGGSAWDMPLHGLRNRRAYLIDSAAQNRYVPALVEGTVQTIACIPLHSGTTPLGSLVLITVRPRVLGERDIRMVERPLRELVKMIEMIRRRGPGAPAGAPSAAPPASRPAPDVAAPASTAPAPDDGARTGLAEIEAALTEERRARGELESALTKERQARSLLEAGLAEERRTREALDATLADERRSREQPDTALVEERRARAELESTLTEERRSRAELETALAEEHRGRAELETTLAEERHSRVELETALTEERRARAERETALAEERRARAERETALAEERHSRVELETALTEERRAGAELQATLSEGRHGRAELEATLTEERRGRAELEAAVARERGLREEAEAARASADRDAFAAAARAQAAQEQAREAQAQARAAEESRAVAATTNHAASSALAETEAETGALRDRLSDLGRQLEAVHSERDELRRSLEGSAAEQEALVAALDAVRAEQGALQATLETSRTECDVLRATAEATSAAGDTPVASDLVVAEAPAAEPITIAAVEPVAAPPTAAAVAVGEPAIVVLDADGQWGDIVIAGTRVVAIAPDAQVEQSLDGIAPTVLVVNLAAPGALEAVRVLRAAGVTAPAVGCIAAPGTGRALALGALDVVSRPIDTDGVVAAVVRASSGPGRLVTASGDVEALLSVRQALTRKGTSVSMAWDAKQALDLLGMMRPDVVLVDLELGRQSCSVVAALDGLDPVPFLLVVPADGDQAEGFGALTREAQRVARMVPLKTVVAGAVKYAEAARRAE